LWLVLCHQASSARPACYSLLRAALLPQLGTGPTLASCPPAPQRLHKQPSNGVKYASKAAPMKKAEIGRATKMTGLPPESIRACLREFSDSFPRTRARIKGTMGYLSLIMT